MKRLEKNCKKANNTRAHKQTNDTVKLEVDVPHH